MPLIDIPNFVVPHQDTDVWCWCALTLAVGSYLGDPRTRSQCQIASDVLGKPSCCAVPMSCFNTNDLYESLSHYGHARGLPVGGFSEAAIVATLSQRCPGCVQVLDTTARHVLGISAIDTDRKLVRVHDPLTNGAVVWWFYNAVGFAPAPLGAFQPPPLLCQATYQTQ